MAKPGQDEPELDKRPARWSFPHGKGGNGRGGSIIIRTGALVNPPGTGRRILGCGAGRLRCSTTNAPDGNVKTADFQTFGAEVRLTPC